MGIAVAEGAVESIEDPIGMYVPEFAGTDLESHSDPRLPADALPGSISMRIRI